MRLLLLLLLCNYSVYTQTLLKYDNIEAYTWTGVWWNLSPGGYYTNASVSGTTSAAIYGAGNGTSVVEQNWYSMPNVTGLNSAYQYEFRFRLASYTFSNSTATTRGVDAADLIEAQVSRNGGVTYVTEFRITGFNNSTWPYQTSGSITHTADGTFNSSTDVYTSASGSNSGLSTGYSVVKLKISGITQIAVDILARVNSAGEEWWIDNVELWQITVPLPVELMSFDGYKEDDRNILVWSTASENNSDYFVLEKSQDGNIWSHVANVYAVGNSIEVNKYVYQDSRFNGYYRLLQYDMDGSINFLGTLALIENKTKYIIKVYDLSGREVDTDYTGIVILVYSDGSIVKNFW